SDWQNEIEAALSSMDALLALLTPGFAASLWCNQEVGWALGRGSLAVSIMCGEPPRGFVGRAQGVQGNDRNVGIIADRVFGVLAGHSLTAEGMGVVAAQRLRAADSWESIRYFLAPDLLRCTFSDVALDILADAFQHTYHVQSSRFLGTIKEQVRQSGRNVD